MTRAPETRELTVDVPDDRARLDRALARAAPEMSRARLQALIRAGHVLVAGVARTDPGHRVRAGDRLSLTIPAPEAATPRAEAMPLHVAYEDAHLIVIDKPAGLVVHPAAGNATGTLVNALIAHCGASLSGIGGVRRPGIVHRLDKDTSGLLVVAKTDVAHQGLAAQFAAHGRDGRLIRAYDALAWGAPLRPKGSIDAPLGRSPAHRTRMAVVTAGSGRPAVTHWERLEVFRDSRGAPAGSRMRLMLETGRTHQIRVHLAHLGHPIMGDATYGKGFATRAATLGDRARTALAALGRQALHAAALGFDHPVDGRAMRFESPLPADIQRLAEALGEAENGA